MASGQPSRSRREPQTAETTYAVFLRSINVGTRNRITMSALCSLVEQTGLRDVSSYLATGNLIVTDPHGRDEVSVSALISERLEGAGLLRVNPSVRTPGEVRDLIGQQRFSGFPEEEYRWLVTFLQSPPPRDGAARLLAKDVHVTFADERVVCTAFRRDRTGFTPAVEAAYGVPATSRWWNVICEFAAALP